MNKLKSQLIFLLLNEMRICLLDGPNVVKLGRMVFRLRDDFFYLTVEFAWAILLTGRLGATLANWATVTGIFGVDLAAEAYDFFGLVTRLMGGGIPIHWNGTTGFFG